MTDVDDLSEFYAATHDRLVLSLLAVTADLAEAEDCVQEAFARAVPRWSQLVRYDNPEAWVYRVSANLARSRWRSIRRAALLRQRLGEPGHAPALTAAHVEVLNALRQLPADQREAVVLYHLVDLPVAEVAERQGVPIGTAKARLSRARRALAEQLSVVDEEVTVND